MSTRSFGKIAEEQAVIFVESLGWKVVGCNLHYRLGEVDILADSGDYLVIIEVKAKANAFFGRAVEMITPAKKRILVLLAKFIGQEYNRPVRIDVITLDNFLADKPEIAHYIAAVGEE